MVEAGLLYADGEQVWKPVTNMGDFKTFDVLTFSFTTERGNRSALLPRMWSRQNNDTKAASDLAWWGDDIYYVGVLPNGDYFTTQIPEDDEKIKTFSGVDGADTGIVECPRTFPADATMHRFIGAYLSPADWERALAVFEAEMF